MGSREPVIGGDEMRVTISVIALVLCTAGSALAQDWDLFTSKEDGFKVDFPGQPRMTATTFKSEYGADLPAHVWTASSGQERYSVTVVDYSVDGNAARRESEGHLPSGRRALVRADPGRSRLLERGHGRVAAMGDLRIHPAPREDYPPRVCVAGPGVGPRASDGQRGRNPRRSRSSRCTRTSSTSSRA